jgi:hypothetical protein
LAGSYEGWSLKVIDQEGTSIVWEDRLDTDVAAYAEFERTIDEEGIEPFFSGRQ